jgi:acyl transferase domain-containing protein
LKDDEFIQTSDSIPGIAVIGMAGRFPGAPNLDVFWDNLRRGVESVTHFSSSELEDAFGRSVQSQPGYVRARSILEGVELFDAGFFNFLPRDAELTDPQQRIFLEIAWEALESAGYDPAAFPGEIAVYAGSSIDTYLLYNVLSDRQRVERFTGNYQVGEFPTLVGNGAAFLATRTAYKLDLRGPAISVQSACSTSLLAIAEACQCLLDYRADIALAGGVSITFPQKRGYLYQEGAMVSPDVHCRSFDADAAGTVFGSGAGVVVLKRLDEALADGDPIRAVIRGSAVNNDGARKVGYTAPSSEGQAKAIALAHAMAGVTADAISYVECHGTATPLGDPIEIAGLTKAFRATTDRKGFCAIGTVKTNIGHLDIASGVTALIKTILALEHESLPATLHFKKPNPALGIEDSPFFVEALGRVWAAGVAPDWRALYEGTHRRRVSLPTYPFQRKRYFIEAPSASPAAEAVPLEGDLRSAMANETLQPAPAPAALSGQQTETLGRQVAIRAALAALLENLSGIDVASAPRDTSFLELGFDSLFLTQASQAIKTRFKVAVSFRQMMGELASLDAVADHLNVAAEDFVVEAAPVAQTQSEAAFAILPPSASPAVGLPTLSGPGQGIEQVMAAPLASMTDLINRQLKTLRQLGGAAPSSGPASAVAAPVRPPAAAPLPAKLAPDKKPVEAFGPFKPFAQVADTGLDAGQRKILAYLIERYTRRTRGSKEMTQASRAVLADPRVASGFNPEWKEMVYPIVTVRSEVITRAPFA